MEVVDLLGSTLYGGPYFNPNSPSEQSHIFPTFFRPAV